jgi:hypothetical protein
MNFLCMAWTYFRTMHCSWDLFIRSTTDKGFNCTCTVVALLHGVSNLVSLVQGNWQGTHNSVHCDC